MCEMTPDCDGDLYYDTCESCGAQLPAVVGDRTNIHLPSEEDYRRQMRKLRRRP